MTSYATPFACSQLHSLQQQHIHLARLALAVFTFFQKPFPRSETKSELVNKKKIYKQLNKTVHRHTPSLTALLVAHLQVSVVDAEHVETSMCGI